MTTPFLIENSEDLRKSQKSITERGDTLKKYRVQNVPANNIVISFIASLLKHQTELRREPTTLRFIAGAWK